MWPLETFREWFRRALYNTGVSPYRWRNTGAHIPRSESTRGLCSRPAGRHPTISICGGDGQFRHRRAGELGIFRDHLLRNVCGGDEMIYRWVFGWFAQIIQTPGEKLGTSLALRGAMGVGKSIVGEIFGKLMGSHYLQVDSAEYVTGKFNAHMTSLLLLQSDEAFWAGDHVAASRIKGSHHWR